MRARLTFGSSGAEQWTEERDLEDVTYALYDPAANADGARAFLDSARLASVRAVDPSLSDVAADVSVDSWIRQELARPHVATNHTIDWTVQYCADRTTEAGTDGRFGDLCAVAYFQAAEDIQRAWFRTGRVTLNGTGAHWDRMPVTLEGINMSHSGAEARSLSELAALLASDRAGWPTGDISIAPDDIVVTPLGADWRQVRISVTVRNAGHADLHGVQVLVGAAPDVSTWVPSRTFVVDVSARSAATLTLDASFPSGYGIAQALALQSGEHAPHDTFSIDPTPEDACAFRIVNAKQAPSGFATEVVTSASGCRGW
jgi:hypothetical protein